MSPLVSFALLSVSWAACPPSHPQLGDSVLRAELLLSGYVPTQGNRLACSDGAKEVALYEDRVLGTYTAVDAKAAEGWMATMCDHLASGSARGATCTPRASGASCVAYEEEGVRHVLELSVHDGQLHGLAGTEDRRLHRSQGERAWFPHAKATVRGGFDRYYHFDFYTVGAEVAVEVIGGVQAVAAFETWNLRMAYDSAPDERFWAHIMPLSAGLMYQLDKGAARPYVGADVITAMYYRDELGQDWTLGGRLRGGADVMLTEHIGLNANLAIGMWQGRNLPYIDDGIGASGALVQGSGGVVFAL